MESVLSLAREHLQRWKATVGARFPQDSETVSGLSLILAELENDERDARIRRMRS
jgi:hypothetical protein